MKTTFLHGRYAEGNGDLAERFGTDADADANLNEHFTRYGQHEMRGIKAEDYIRLEAVFCSDRGHIQLAGWADRRLIHSFHVTVEVGYIRYDLGEVTPCWYERADVTAVTGDTQQDSGYLALLKIDGLILHSGVRILINDKKMYDEPAMRWLSIDSFLTRSLSACAVLADQPVGNTLSHAQALYPQYAEIWGEYLDGLTFSAAFQHRAQAPVARSIIITLHRKAEMLLIQLDSLAEALTRDGETEVIVIGNELAGAQLLVEQLGAFCQIHDIPLSLHLCSGNSGFSAGNNHGAEIARGEILIFMNPDIFPPETAPERGTDFLFSDPGEDLHGALLYYGDGMLMHSGMYTTADLAFNARSGVSAPVLRVEHFGKGLTHHVDDAADIIAPTLAAIAGQPVLASAALWKIRKTVFDAVGGLPIDYLFAYYEDADFCLALRGQGRDIVIDNTARWIHMEGVGKAKPAHVRSFMWLNRALYSQKFADSDLLSDESADLSLL
ncbi:glycosyltransferase family 2 protein [Oceaniovalibus sp. ACAM 378]|uniref:glycosyltransferase family 2 protein n=1 Tax=Oceaniovalibus sp. ACAM 378 TaxID=2599923 RepID=UPI0011DA0F4D|nr:glycosyltransferase [Oceaniovalibus sp. ACAM 378]TYB84071.1 glycosyltransferase family 2 protein [Oceaniovalibus sp. ACAM 378]